MVRVAPGALTGIEQVSFGGAAPSQIVTGFSGTFEDDPPAVGDAVSLAALDGGCVLRR